MSCPTTCKVVSGANRQSERTPNFLIPTVRVNGRFVDLPPGMKIDPSAIGKDESSALEAKTIAANVTISAANVHEYADRIWNVTAAATITLAGPNLNLGKVTVLDPGKVAAVAVSGGETLNGATASIARTGATTRVFQLVQIGASNVEMF